MFGLYASKRTRSAPARLWRKDLRERERALALVLTAQLKRVPGAGSAWPLTAPPNGACKRRRRGAVAADSDPGDVL